MRERSSFWWTCGKRANGLRDTCRERFTWAKESSNGTLSSACRTPARGSFFIAAEVFAPRLRRTICRRWVTATWNRWTAGGEAGQARDCQHKKGEAEESRNRKKAATTGGIRSSQVGRPRPPRKCGERRRAA